MAAPSSQSSEVPTKGNDQDSKSIGYVLPNDSSQEVSRLDAQHEGFKLTFGGKHFLSPIANPQAILDVGAGTSVWPIAVANQFPNAQVTGIDLGQPQPPSYPSNYTFHIHNFEDDWSPLLPTNTFDLIHSRLIFIALKNHKRYISQSLTHLKPGGWLEIQDLNFPWGWTGPAAKWSEHMMEGAKILGQDLEALSKFDVWMAEAGFHNIEHRIFLLPHSTWPSDPHLKEVGKFAQKSVYDGLPGFTNTVFTKVLGWSQEDTDKFVKEIREELMRDDHRWYAHIHVVYGQKPMES